MLSVFLSVVFGVPPVPKVGPALGAVLFWGHGGQGDTGTGDTGMGDRDRGDRGGHRRGQPQHGEVTEEWGWECGVGGTPVTSGLGPLVSPGYPHGGGGHVLVSLASRGRCCPQRGGLWWHLGAIDGVSPGPRR